MKKFSLSLFFALLVALSSHAQQVMFASLNDLAEGKGDTVTILQVQKRTKNQINLMGGADYRISADDNTSMGRYLKRRCFAVQIDTTLYVNCKKMRYKKFRLGNWYAKALWVNGTVFYAAQPVGQVATGNIVPEHTPKLGGEVGDAIQASGLTDERVYYELNMETGRSEFVGRERMLQLLAGKPELKKQFEQETSENASTIEPYLIRLRN